jgi:hypothetical protein
VSHLKTAWRYFSNTASSVLAFSHVVLELTTTQLRRRGRPDGACGTCTCLSGRAQQGAMFDTSKSKSVCNGLVSDCALGGYLTKRALEDASREQ